MYIISNLILVTVIFRTSSKILDTNNFVRVAYKNQEQKLNPLQSCETRKCNYPNAITYHSTGCQTFYREQSTQTKVDLSKYYIPKWIEQTHEHKLSSQKRYDNINLSDSTKAFDLFGVTKWEEWLLRERNLESNQMARQRVAEYTLHERTKETTQTSDQIIEEAIATQIQTKKNYIKNIT